MGAKNDDQLIGDLIIWVNHQLDKGFSRESVVDQLAEQGLDYDVASDLVNRVYSARESHRFERAERNKAATQNIGIGLLIFLIGWGITLVTYAVTGPGGTYIITWGAVAVGAFYVVKGLFRKISSSGVSDLSLGWIVASVIIVAIMAGGSVVAYNGTIGAEAPEPPGDSMLQWTDLTSSEIGRDGSLTFRGTIENIDSKWSAENVLVNIALEDTRGEVPGTFSIRPSPSTIEAGSTISYSQPRNLPFTVIGYSTEVEWEWVLE